MNKKTWKYILLAGLLTLSACSQDNGASSESMQTKQLVYGMSSEIEKVNPVLDGSQEIDSLLFRGLTKTNAEKQTIP